MSTTLLVPIGQERSINQSGDYDVTLNAGSTVRVGRTATTPSGDAVNVTFDSLNIIALSRIEVSAGLLNIDGIAGVGLLATFDIGDFGRLNISDTIALNVGTQIQFTGTGGILEVSGRPSIGLLNGISGFDSNDVIKFDDVGNVTDVRYQGGIITLYDNADVVASIAVSGNFDGDRLGFQRDGSGGFNVGVGLGNGGGLQNDQFRTGIHSEYIVAETQLGQLYLQDQVGGRDGIATINDAKYILFADGIGRFDASGVAQEIAHLYEAAFNRQADSEGLEFWTNFVESGQLNYSQVAQQFTTSAEYLAEYRGLDDLGFINRLYQNILDRPGEASGVAFWNAQLERGATRADVLLGFSTSFENIVVNLDRVGDTQYGQAYRLYEAALNRAPETSGLSFWYNLLESGVSLNDVAGGFIASNEYQVNYGGLGNEQFVQQLYANVLNRAGEQQGVDFWVNLLETGTARTDVLIGFSESLENRYQTAEQTHDSWIFFGGS